ncbi:hypothetical protein GGR58DRAFT_453234 [Xylaria digitata]|nr:hypothetical protein GGR58DRAFT_453234 [Xylaria digitata]
MAGGLSALGLFFGMAIGILERPRLSWTRRSGGMCGLSSSSRASSARVPVSGHASICILMPDSESLFSFGRAPE